MCNPWVFDTECCKVLHTVVYIQSTSLWTSNRVGEGMNIFYRVKQRQYHQEPRRLCLRNTMVSWQSSSARAAEDMPFCMCLDWIVARHMNADSDHYNLAKSVHLHELGTNWICRNTGVGRLTANLGSRMPWSCPNGSRNVIDKILKEISTAMCRDSETRKKPHKAQNAPTGDIQTAKNLKAWAGVAASHASARIFHGLVVTSVCDTHSSCKTERRYGLCWFLQKHYVPSKTFEAILLSKKGRLCTHQETQVWSTTSSD
jgi:hypothetical protein